MTEIKTVVFDYGGVISNRQREDMIPVLAEKVNLEEEVFTREYFSNRFEYDRGVLSGADYWRKLDSSLSDEAVWELIELDARSWLDINEATVGLIRELSGKTKLAILSNMPYEMLPHLPRGEWMECFSLKLFSCDLKDIKPNDSIYRTLIEETGSRPGEILFIDDSPDNISSAAANGIRGICYDGKMDLKQETYKIINGG